jgi:uncharacterized protein (DUF1499 family)
VLVLIITCSVGQERAIAAPVVSQAKGAIAQPIAQLSLGGTVFSFSGTRPDNLGVKDGKLASCPSSPNCVSSQSPTSDSTHFIEPLTYTSSPEAAMQALKSVIQDMERTKIITEEKNYLYAEFTSALMGFVDDVEFYLDESAGVIHVRSASRLGESDLGVNRKRIEEIREKFA